MEKAKKTTKQLRRMETFLAKELERYKRFEERLPDARDKDHPVMRGFREGMSERRAAAEGELRDVKQAIAALEDAPKSRGKHAAGGDKSKAKEADENAGRNSV